MIARSIIDHFGGKEKSNYQSMYRLWIVVDRESRANVCGEEDDHASM